MQRYASTILHVVNILVRSFSQYPWLCLRTALVLSNQFSVKCPLIKKDNLVFPHCLFFYEECKVSLNPSCLWEWILDMLARLHVHVLITHYKASAYVLDRLQSSKYNTDIRQWIKPNTHHLLRYWHSSSGLTGSREPISLQILLHWPGRQTFKKMPIQYCMGFKWLVL